MPGFGGDYDQNAAITPYRKTTAEFDLPESQILRPPWATQRGGPEIARAPGAGQPATSNVMLWPAGVWGLRPFQATHSYERTEGNAGIIRASQFNVASGVVEKPFWKAPSLSGVVVDGGVAAVGDHFFFKRIEAAASWVRSLTADVAAYPGPTVTPNVPLDRIAASKSTYPENQGYAVRLQVPGARVQSHDHVARVLFGGPAGAKPHGKSAGEMCLDLLGNGLATLYEKLDGGWTGLAEMRWAPPGKVAGRSHSLLIAPHAPDRLSLHTPSTDHSAPLTMAPRQQLIPSPSVVHANSFVTRPPVVDYTSKRNMTGPGPIRLEHRQDLRVRMQVSTLQYPTSGTLTDLPFFITTPPLRPATPIAVFLRASTPAGTTIGVQLYDAKTHAALTANADGTFQAVGGQNAYYAKFTFTGDGTKSPTLTSYEVYVAGVRQERSAVTPVTGGRLLDVGITGPDLDPTHESISFTIDDLKNELTLLRGRGRIHSRLRTQYDPDDATKKVTLWEGELANVSAYKTGRNAKQGFAGTEDRVYPSASRRRLECLGVGMWVRLADQLSLVQKDFSIDVDNPENRDADGNLLPSKVTSIVRWVLQEAGAPPDQLDIPDLPLRAFASGVDKYEYLLQPGANLLGFVQKLVRDYLGAFLVYEPDSGTRGKWKLILPPQPPYTVRWHFTTSGPGAGKRATHPAAYAANTTFIPRNRLVTEVKPPEANLVIVTATGELLPNNNGATIRAAVDFNPASFDFNPDSPTAFPTLDDGSPNPDYLGRIVPLIYYNANLSTQADVNFTCKRLAAQVMFAQKWARIRAPLVFIDDADDPDLAGKRKLRTYDAITINGHEALVRHIGPEIRRDRQQWMDVWALFTDNTFTGP